MICNNYNYIIKYSKTKIETNINKMSEIVDQIDKLKAKAHSLKEGVSICLLFIV